MSNLKFYLFLGSQALATLVLLIWAALWPGRWNVQRMLGTGLLVGVGKNIVRTANKRGFRPPPELREEG